MNKIETIISFLTLGIWRVKIDELSKIKLNLIRPLQTLILTFKGFNEDNCMLRASALTFYTLMSIVPVFAMAFGIAKGFNLEQVLEDQLMNNFIEQQEILGEILKFARNLLQRTQGGLVAGIGVVFLLWTVVKLLGNIEFALNDIWGIQKNRTFGRKMGDYLVIMAVAPIFLIMAGSVNVYITSFLGKFTETPYSALIGPIIYFVLKLIPYVILWFVFTFLYMFMPNIKVSWKAGIISGIIAGTLFQILQWGYFALQIGMIRNNQIYGSFAALPLFLIWLEFSWMIVLFGAEISYAFQNVKTYDYEPDSKNASIALQKIVAIYIVITVIKRFDDGKPPMTSDEVADELELPARLARKVFGSLEKAGVLIRVDIDDDEEFDRFNPAVPMDRLTIEYVHQCLEEHGVSDIPIKKSKTLDKIVSNMKKIQSSSLKSPGNLHLRDL